MKVSSMRVSMSIMKVDSEIYYVFRLVLFCVRSLFRLGVDGGMFRLRKFRLVSVRMVVFMWNGRKVIMGVRLLGMMWCYMIC